MSLIYREGRMNAMRRLEREINQAREILLENPPQKQLDYNPLPRLNTARKDINTVFQPQGKILNSATSLVHFTKHSIISDNHTVSQQLVHIHRCLGEQFVQIQRLKATIAYAKLLRDN
jgi:hypothetical protein